MPRKEQEAIVRAALAAHAGRHSEAEAARFAGDYHNLRVRTDADGYMPAV
jgi:hypothetical protein